MSSADPGREGRVGTSLVHNKTSSVPTSYCHLDTLSLSYKEGMVAAETLEMACNTLVSWHVCSDLTRLSPVPRTQLSSCSPGASLCLSPVQVLPFPVSHAFFFGSLLHSWNISSSSF